MKLKDDIVDFFKSQGFVIVSTIERGKKIHSSCKGMIDIKKDGRVYILDLYHGKTFKNLKKDSAISITAVDTHLYKGYLLQGKARIVNIENVSREILKAGEKNISRRVSKRLIKNIKQDKKSLHHPEAKLPFPKYLILMEIDRVINLAPDK